MYTANPRFDPLRNAREMGLTEIPISFLPDSDHAGSTEQTATTSPDYGSKVAWFRIGLVLLAIVAIWKLGK